MQLNKDMTTMPGKISIQKKRQCGFTLLEVLIALLVLSIGLLGLAALQTIGLRSNTMASFRTQATQIAYDIADRIRANPKGEEFYDLPTIDDGPGTPPAQACDDPARTTACGSEEMANFDMTQWRAAVALLPGGRSEIVRNVDADGVVTHSITVYWDEERKGIDPDAGSGTGLGCGTDTSVDLRCMQLTM
jgi:type IV pilus assembly protein PilV